jgi:hypothetical protein
MAQAVSELLLSSTNVEVAREKRKKQVARSQRIMSVLQGDDSLESLVLDLRKQRQNPRKFNRWFRIARRYIARCATACHERWHTRSEYLTSWMSGRDFTAQVWRYFVHERHQLKLCRAIVAAAKAAALAAKHGKVSRDLACSAVATVEVRNHACCFNLGKLATVSICLDDD